MSNPKRAEVLLNLDRPRTMKLDFNVMCTAEGQLGHSIVRAEMGLSDIRALVWAGCRQDDRTLTVERVGEMLNEASLPEIMEKLGKALGEFFNQGEATGAGSTSTG